MSDPFKIEFDVSIEQLAHDLAMLQLSQVPNKPADISQLYEMYLEILNNDVWPTIIDKLKYIEDLKLPERLKRDT